MNMEVSVCFHTQISMGVAITILLLSCRLGEGLFESSSLDECGSDRMLRFRGVGRRQEVLGVEACSPCLWEEPRVALEARQEALLR